MLLFELIVRLCSDTDLVLMHEEVGDALAMDIMSDMPEDPKCERFANYMVDTYVDPDSRFPPELWAAEPSSLEIRTTNGAESYHAHLYVKVGGMSVDFTKTDSKFALEAEADLRIGEISRLEFLTKLGHRFAVKR